MAIHSTIKHIEGILPHSTIQHIEGILPVIITNFLNTEHKAKEMQWLNNKGTLLPQFSIPTKLGVGREVGVGGGADSKFAILVNQ